MDSREAARAFLDAHTRLLAIAAELAPIEARYLSDDGLGSAGMEVDGHWKWYQKKTQERGEVVAELRAIRNGADDESLLAELGTLPGAERAREYIRKVPLRKPKREEK